MAPSPAPWQLALARLEGALPFLGNDLAASLALASLRRLWRVHVRDFAFENIGLEHDPGLEAAELMRSWYSEERRDLLSWVSRRGPPPLARAAGLALKAKGASESFTSTFDAAERALERLDALLPAADPLATLAEWMRQLREDETPFLEGGSEFVEVGGHVFSRFASRGAGWAASLAAAMRPQLFALGAAPLALAGLAPRSLFQQDLESPLPSLLSTAIGNAAIDVASDLLAMRQALNRRDLELRALYASSHARQAWQLISALGPLTRAELARALDVTPRTASQAVVALENANLVRLRPADKVILAANA